MMVLLIRAGGFRGVSSWDEEKIAAPTQGPLDKNGEDRQEFPRQQLVANHRCLAR